MKSKIYYFALLCVLSSFLNANVLTKEDIEQEMSVVKGPYDENVVREYIQIFHDISKERKVMDDKEINGVENPFIVPPKPIENPNAIEVKPIEYNLYAIVEDRVNINNQWYRQNDKIKSPENARLVKIKSSSVILKIANKTKEIQLSKGSENVQVSFQ